MDDAGGDGSRIDRDPEYDVAIVGGGPAGCSAGVFTARYGLETVVFDRGNSSIRRCAHLENYPGFPGGIDVGTLYGLMHDHARAIGCTVRKDLVESVDRREEVGGFVVETQLGDEVTAGRVIAATRYDGEYLRGLDDEAAMFETHEHDGEELAALREREIDRRFDTYIPGTEIDRRTERGHDRLLERLDDDRILEAARGIEAGRRTAGTSPGDRS